MAMNRTEGFYKTFIEVSYVSDQGDSHHLASFQIYAGKNMTDACVRRDEFREKGIVVLDKPIQDYLEAMRAKKYSLSLEVRVMA